ncbi:uncharacterized protein ARMOST_20475 [Armillaria ostoyae]|uniref:Uncharacterized protein n=1 Tax=Armillaria ostoyae TaxID=47428 RepID=A0A284S7G1_ARMOS|nr:uncharacterized protein ARMOST_20475 [Armillaria ostoyae]
MGEEPTNPTPQRRVTYHPNSSDELPPPPRNATLGPSNVPRTPPPAYNPEEAEDYGRYLWACFCVLFPDPHLTLHTATNIPDAQTPIRVLILEPTLQHPATASTIWVGTPEHLAPYPAEDSDSDSSDYGGNEPVTEQADDDPLNSFGGDYEWPELGAIDRVILGLYRSQAWELRWLNIEQQSHFHTLDEQVPMGYYLAIA